MKKFPEFLTIIFSIFLFSPVMGQWITLNAGTSVDFTGISFPSENTGYVMAKDSAILRTNDGGSIWKPVTSIILSPGSFWQSNELLFINDSVGFVTDLSKKLYKTLDYGNSWSDVSPANVEHINRVQFLNDQKGFIYAAPVNNEKLYITKDGGLSWEETGLNFTLWSGTTSIGNMFFADENTGYLAGSDASFNYRGRIMKTTDAGQTWSDTVFGQYTVMESLLFPNKDTGYALTRYGDLYRTTNAGNSWDSIYSFDNTIRNGIFFTGGTTGYIADAGIIYKTTDAGNNWVIDYQDTAQAAFFSALSFPNKNTGYAVGSQGKIIKTSTTTSGVKHVAGNLNLDLYPNPTTGKLRLTSSSGLLDMIVVYNFNGKEIYRAPSIQKLSVNLDFSDYPTGLYYLKVFEGEKFDTKKVMKY